MEKPTRRRFRDRSKRFKALVIGIPLLIVIIAVVVPVSVVYTRHRQHEDSPGRAKVIVPLYIYPDSGAWDPLYRVLKDRPNVDFTVIVNPASGPGSESYPNSDYLPQIQKLNTYSNVQTIGYVRTNYTTRNIDDVLRDVRTYSAWTSNSTLNQKGKTAAMHGIFFDEAPTDYSEATATYLTTINQAVKNATGLQGAKTVVHNPGAIPDGGLNVANTDITVVFEQAYDEYQRLMSNLTALSQPRSSKAYMIHSTPDTVDTVSFVNSLVPQAEYLFVTDLSENYYQSFGRKWTDFVDAI